MKKFLLLAAAALMAVACNKDDNNNPIENVKEAIEDPELQGKTFQSDCFLEPIDALLTGILTGGKASVKSSRVQYKFTGANITRTTIAYLQADCAGEAFTYRESGDFNVTKNQKTNDGGYFIDIHYNKLMLQMNSAAGVTAANALHLCGATDWVEGQEREVSAQAKDLLCYGAPVPRTNLNVYRVDAGKYLLFGIPSTENNKLRPTHLTAVKYTAK